MLTLISADVTTGVVVLAETLFACPLGPFVVLVRFTELTIDEVTPEPTFNVIENGPLVPAGNVATVHVRVWAACTHPVPEKVAIVVPVGAVKVSTAFAADEGPLFAAVPVNTSCPPAVTGIGLLVSVMARSASAPVVT